MVAYIAEEEYPYKAIGRNYSSAKPVKYKTRVIGPVEMMEGLLKKGLNKKNDGNWNNGHGLESVRKDISSFCGKIKTDNLYCSDWMFEEIEV